MLDPVAFTQPAFHQAPQQTIQTIEKPAQNLPKYRAEMNGKTYRCYAGENGISTRKKEGDKTTPAGDFALKKVFYRSDRIQPHELKTKLPTQAITPNDGWCDDPKHPQYNQFIKLPFKGSHEKLWMNVDYYDLVIVTDYNMNPTIPGKGSAIFVHIKDRDSRGCLGFTKKDLLEIVNQADASTRLRISDAGDIQFYQASKKVK